MNRVDQKFEKGLAGLQSISLSSKEKGAIFGRVSRYVESHPAVTEEHYFAAFQRMLRGIFSTISWK